MELTEGSLEEVWKWSWEFEGRETIKTLIDEQVIVIALQSKRFNDQNFKRCDQIRNDS